MTINENGLTPEELNELTNDVISDVTAKDDPDLDSITFKSVTEYYDSLPIRNYNLEVALREVKQFIDVHGEAIIVFIKSEMGL